MFRSYLSVVALLCLAAAIGCETGGENGGSGGSAGSNGSGGGGGGGGGEGTAVTATISLGCTNNVTGDVSILDWDLSIDPGGPVGPSEEFTAQVDGVAFFAESFLDAALATVPGLQRAALVDIAATVLPRSGATGDKECDGGDNDGEACTTDDMCADTLGTCVGGEDVGNDCTTDDTCADTLGTCAGGGNVGQDCTTTEQCPDSTCDGADLGTCDGADLGTCDGADLGTCVAVGVVLREEPVPYTCAISPFGPCDPANDAPPPPTGTGGNTDCIPTGGFNLCLRFLALPTTDVEAECEALGEPKITQFADNGFCITGPLPLPLEAQEVTYAAAPSGNMLFGWDDVNTGATVKDDGSYALPPAIFPDPVEPNGLRVSAILSVALQCTMAVDSGGPPAEGGVTLCDGGANDGQPCLSPADSSNDFCVGGDTPGDNCDPAEATDCPGGGVCENADCGAGASCSPSDQSSPTPDSALLSIPIVE